MAVYLPIISEFNSKGIDRARREFQSLSTVGEKSAFLLKKAFIPATAALTGLAVVIGDAVQGAIEDQKAQAELARVLRVTTKATDAQIKVNEDWIATQGRLLGVTDDDLRPALAKLVRVTKDVSKAQQIAALGMDLAAATGKDLGTVTDALTKAYAGNMKGLRALAPEVAGLIKDGATFDQVMAALNSTMGTAAEQAATTTAGKLQIFRVRVDELKESLAVALLPVFNTLLPVLSRFQTWAENNPGLLKGVIAGVVALTAATVALNVAAALNPWVALTVGLVALVVYLERAYGLVTALVAAFEKIRPGMTEALQKVRTGPTGVGAGFGGGAVGAGGQVIVNVSGGDPQAIIDAIKRWSIQNGPLPVGIRTQ